MQQCLRLTPLPPFYPPTLFVGATELRSSFRSFAKPEVKERKKERERRKRGAVCHGAVRLFSR